MKRMLNAIWIHWCYNVIFYHLTNITHVYFGWLTVIYAITGALFLLYHYGYFAPLAIYAISQCFALYHDLGMVGWTGGIRPGMDELKIREMIRTYPKNNLASHSMSLRAFFAKQSGCGVGDCFALRARNDNFRIDTKPK